MFENSEVYLRSSRRKAFLLYKPLLSLKVYEFASKYQKMRKCRKRNC